MTIEQAVNDNHVKTGGKCGLTLPQLMEVTKTDLKSLKIELNKLWKEDKIKIREGINGKLIFWNGNNG